MDLKNIEYVLFDLDGTITEPFDGITKAVQYSLSKLGVEVEDRNTLKPFIGPPLKYGYMTFFGFDEERAIEAVRLYREYYSNGGMYDCQLYDGVEALLRDMSKKFRLVLATSKPQPFAEKILEKFDLKKYFYHLVGATFDDKVSEKSDVIRKVIADLNLDPAKALMIGDRYYDTDGAKENGVASVGVTYGYGEREEFKSAELIFDSVEEMYNYFCR